VFLADAPLRLADARAALERGDAAAIAAQAHGLKSMVGLFTRAEAFSAVRELEAVAKQGDLAGAAKALTTVEGRVAMLEARLRTVRAELEAPPSPTPRRKAARRTRTRPQRK
jgi:hypothetical protein